MYRAFHLRACFDKPLLLNVSMVHFSKKILQLNILRNVEWFHNILLTGVGGVVLTRFYYKFLSSRTADQILWPCYIRFPCFAIVEVDKVLT